MSVALAHLQLCIMYLRTVVNFVVAPVHLNFAIISKFAAGFYAFTCKTRQLNLIVQSMEGFAI